MRSLVKDHKLLLLLVLAFLVSELIVNPIGNFPLNDDWSYGKSVMQLLKDGTLEIGLFPSMTLLSHLAWGLLFTKLFGFSFTVLRVSTLFSSLIGITLLNKLIIGITGNKQVAFILCLCLLFNPIYFNLSNTYMTDVNFITVLIVICYFSFVFFQTGSILSFMLVILFSLILVLIRQFGIIAPLCFVFSCLFLKNKRWLYAVLSVLGFLLVIVIFKYYEGYLKTHLHEGASYKYSGDIHIGDNDFWDYFWFILRARYTSILLHVLFYCFPFLVIFLWKLVKDGKIWLRLFISAGFIGGVIFLFKGEPFPMGNIFTNMSLGTETFFETLYSDHKAAHSHTYSLTAEWLADGLKYIFLSISFVCCVWMFYKFVRTRSVFFANPYLIFLSTLFFAYLFVMLVSKSYFDRYNLPLITIALLLFSFAARYYKTDYRLAVIPLLLFFYISVCGTKDYLRLNKTRWEAYTFLKNALHADYEKIDGGFEVNCWNEGKPYANDFYSLNACEFLIQYSPEKNFRILREYEFQRYFPFKKDKIYIFRKVHTSHSE